MCVTCACGAFLVGNRQLLLAPAKVIPSGKEGYILEDSIQKHPIQCAQNLSNASTGSPVLPFLRHAPFPLPVEPPAVDVCTLLRSGSVQRGGSKLTQAGARRQHLLSGMAG